MPLNNTQVKNAQPRDKDYKLSDGGGLYMLVAKSGGKRWRLKYRFHGKEKTLSIGTYPLVSLAEARQAREVAKKLLLKGVDPSQDKKRQKLAGKARTENTFKAVALDWHNAQSSRWKDHYAKRVMKSLEQRVFPYIGDMPIADITAPDVLNLLRKLEAEELGDTTHRIKQRISGIFVFAIAEGKANYDPAAGLEKALAPPPKVQNRKRLKIDELGGFMRDLENYDGDLQTRLALNLIVLTFVRSGELRFAEWSEFDLDNAVWTIPAQHMKMGAEHVVPLSRQAVDILRQLYTLNGHRNLVLPSPQRPAKPISENTMLFAIYRLGYKNRTTVHGFRGTASTELNEAGFKNDIIERQLAHVERNKTRAAYNHAEYLKERTQMMQWWGDRVDGLRERNNVIFSNFGKL